jgi:hypothetical protein
MYHPLPAQREEAEVKEIVKLTLSTMLTARTDTPLPNGKSLPFDHLHPKSSENEARSDVFAAIRATD